MSEAGLRQAREKMEAAGVDPVAVEVFTHYYRELESGATGMIPEADIEPVRMDRLADVPVPDDVAHAAIGRTAVVKLNGGLGTSMGMDRAKSLLDVGGGLRFIDVIVGQVQQLRRRYDVSLPLLFMDSFRTREDTLAALADYPDLPVDGLPLDFLQNAEPKLAAADLTPASWPADPSLEWCPPGHGDLYPALLGSGLLDRLAEAGYTQVFCSNSDNLGAVPDARVAGWFAQSGAPFALEATRRTASDRKGGHLAVRRRDGQLVLRETAQTPAEDAAALADLDRHRYASTNNLWFDLAAMREELRRTGGVLGLPLIKNTKHVDPADPTSPEVIQVETAMGAAVQVFGGATPIEVSRERFVPVKTTDDLLVLRSDAYRLGEDFVPRLADGRTAAPYVSLDSDHYKLMSDFDARFPGGPPSLAQAGSLTVAGDWTFEAGVVVRGEADVTADGSPGRVRSGTVLGG